MDHMNILLIKTPPQCDPRGAFLCHRANFPMIQKMQFQKNP